MSFWVLKYSDGSYAAIDWNAGGYPWKVDTLYDAIRYHGLFASLKEAEWFRGTFTDLTPVEIVLMEKV